MIKNIFFKNMCSICKLILLIVLFSVKCNSDDRTGYDLRIGSAIDIFANYGDLSQVTQVVSSEYEDEYEQEPIEPFREKNIRIFANAESKESNGDPVINDLSVEICENFDQLMAAYFKNYIIEGTGQPWKAFMGDWIPEEIMRTLGIQHDRLGFDNCCYVLLKMSKTHKSVKLGNLTSVAPESYVQTAIDGVNFNDTPAIRKFMKSYGTHYIESYSTGNFVYQVYKFKRIGFNLLKAYLRVGHQLTSENLRYYFSSFFLREIGDIRLASGNKTTETWVQQNLRDSHYLYSRPSLLRLHYNPILALKLTKMMENEALLSLNLKTLRPVFRDKDKAEKYAEVVENDMKLWEVNA